MSDARAAYEGRLAERTTRARRVDRWDAALSGLRGALVLAALVLGWLIVRRHALPVSILGLPGVAFLVAMTAHDRVAGRRARLERALRLYRRALARLEGKWDAQPEQGQRFLDPRHPYAADLDLFGPHSLFQLLCTARTAGGEATLASWLTTPAAPGAIRERQAAVDELRPRLDLREALWIAGADVHADVDGQRLAAWGAAASALPWRWLPPLLFLMAAAMAATGAAWMTGHLTVAPAALAAAVVVTLTQLLHRRSAAVVVAVSRPEAHLALLAALTRVMEREFSVDRPAASPRLRWLREQLMVEGQPASRQIARLGRLVRLLDWQSNLVFSPIGYALLWRPQLACAIEAWRRRNGRRIGVWMDALNELEALGALATLAFEHPERPFPRVEESDAGPVYAATGLRHPLLPDCVPNNVYLGGGTPPGVIVATPGVHAASPPAPPPRLIILSGSNMSGKSTLMRTVGVNAVLALAGAPVDAEALTLSPLVLGATLRIQDSLVAGTSRFYAEVTRLRLLVDLARGPTPLLFLIDEILAGTNSHDRRLGAIAVLRGLVDLGAIGIASTHDLALTDVAGQLPGRAINHHFQDDLKDGVLTFDYKLRPGVVQHSNALALMRAVGLEV